MSTRSVKLSDTPFRVLHAPCRPTPTIYLPGNFGTRLASRTKRVPAKSIAAIPAGYDTLATGPVAEPVD